MEPSPTAEATRLTDLVDQVLRHPGGQGIATDHDRHPLGVPRQVDRGLAGRVGATGKEDVLTGEGGAFGRGRPIEHAGAEQGVHAGSAEPAVGHARGDQDAVGMAYTPPVPFR